MSGITATTEPVSAECPECAAAITLTSPIVGEITNCTDCGVELEVSAISPLAVIPAPEEAEDWGE